MKKFAVAFGVFTGVLGILGAVLTEGALKLRPEYRWKPDVNAAKRVAEASGAKLQDVEVETTCREVLKAWYLEAAHDAHQVVVLLHGVAASRSQMLGYAQMLLANGYSVLLPDLRGHGISGGEVITYGVLEAEDTALWSDWLRRERQAHKVYGLGESLGGSVLIQSLAAGAQFQAIAAECAYSSFREVARDRVMPNAGPLFWPVVTGGFVYARLRYGVDLDTAEPLTALQKSAVPALLIHGDQDFETPLAHSMRLANANSRAEIWVVPRARHVGAFGIAKEEFSRRVTQWFQRF